jgi:hypothetical protein
VFAQRLERPVLHGPGLLQRGGAAAAERLPAADADVKPGEQQSGSVDAIAAELFEESSPNSAQTAGEDSVAHAADVERAWRRSRSGPRPQRGEKSQRSGGLGILAELTGNYFTTLVLMHSWMHC